VNTRGPTRPTWLENPKRIGDGLASLIESCDDNRYNAWLARLRAGAGLDETMSLHTERYAWHRLRNTAHSLLLIGLLLSVSSVVGWAVAGGPGIVLMLAIAASTAFYCAIGLPYVRFRIYNAYPVSPRDDAWILGLLRELAERAGLSNTPRLYVIQSPIRNAFALGVGPNAAIGITVGLLRAVSPRELAGILAHEISHISNRDTITLGIADSTSRITFALSQLALLAVVILFPIYLFTNVEFPWLAVWVAVFAPAVSTAIQLALSRSREFDADANAAYLTGDPEGLATALRKLERLQNPWWERLLLPGRQSPDPSPLRSHPSTTERVERLLELDSRFHSEPLRFDTWRAGPFKGRGTTDSDLGPARWRFWGNWY